MADFLIVDNDKNQIKYKEKKWFSFSDIVDILKSTFSKVKTKEKIQFFRLMSTMLNAWLSMTKAVWVLEKQQQKWRFKEILWKFYGELNKWKKLSECFEMYPNDFNEAEVWNKYQIFCRIWQSVFVSKYFQKLWNYFCHYNINNSKNY